MERCFAIVALYAIHKTPVTIALVPSKRKKMRSAAVSQMGRIADSRIH